MRSMRDSSRRVGRGAGVERGGQSGAADAHDVASGAARPTSFRWSTPTFSSATRCSTASSPFDGIRVDPKDLRLQLEQEAMGKLIKLRQGVLASGNDGAAPARAARRERERDHDHLSRVAAAARRDAADGQRRARRGGRRSRPAFDAAPFAARRSPRARRSSR